MPRAIQAAWNGRRRVVMAARIANAHQQATECVASPDGKAALDARVSQIASGGPGAGDDELAERCRCCSVDHGQGYECRQSSAAPSEQHRDGQNGDDGHRQ